ncbi:MAG TPA: hypothetical protein VKT80_05795, partial [Chloroflexota bacterium]|nr:hypothetical protein [Chloroflexota bacterium]
VDVVASTDPIAPAEILASLDNLLVTGEYGVEASLPGFVLLRRGGVDNRIPDSFSDFARAPGSDLAGETKISTVRFSSQLALDGYRLRFLPTLTVFGPILELTTFWRADRPQPSDLSFVFYPTRKPDGAIVGAIRDQSPAAIWYPPVDWTPGEAVAVTVRIERERDLQAVGVGLIDAQSGAPLLVESPFNAVTWDDGTIARVLQLDGG